MRLSKLILHAFGHFTDKSFNFGETQNGKSDFHIFHGANETGKTTIMEAWLRLLFGIQSKSEQYAFHHGRKNLSLSAILEENGHKYQINRVPQGHSSVLLDEKGHNVDSVLLPFLGHLRDEHDYRNLLCLDDRTIEEGGDDIIKSKGKIGNLLFSTASGITDFSDILKEREAKAEEIYRQRASSTQLAELKRDYECIKKQISEADISSARYQELKTQVATAEKDEHDLKLNQQTASDKMAKLQNALEKHQSHAKEQQVFEQYTKKIADKFIELGLAETCLQAEDMRSLYQNLAVFILDEQRIENLRRAQAKIAALAEKITEEQRNLQGKTQKVADGQQILDQLYQNLPPQTDSDKLCSALAEYQGGQLKQTYRGAVEKQKAEKQRFEMALAELTTQGEHFFTLPQSSISARDAERLLAEQRAVADENKKLCEEEKILLERLSLLKKKLGTNMNSTGKNGKGLGI